MEQELCNGAEVEENTSVLSSLVEVTGTNRLMKWGGALVPQ